MSIVPTEHTHSEFDTFTKAVEHILSVPKSVILQREAEHRRLADLNPHKRGPKSKVKRPRAYPGAASKA